MYWRESVGSFEPGNEISETALLTTTLRSFQNGTHYFHFHYFFIGRGCVFSFCMKFHVKQSFPSHLLINFRTEEENNSRWLQFSFTKNPQSKSTWSCFWLKGLCYRDRRSEKEKKKTSVVLATVGVLSSSLIQQRSGIPKYARRLQSQPGRAAL